MCGNRVASFYVLCGGYDGMRFSRNESTVGLGPASEYVGMSWQQQIPEGYMPSRFRLPPFVSNSAVAHQVTLGSPVHPKLAARGLRVEDTLPLPTLTNTTGGVAESFCWYWYGRMWTSEPLAKGSAHVGVLIRDLEIVTWSVAPLEIPMVCRIGVGCRWTGKQSLHEGHAGPTT